MVGWVVVLCMLGAVIVCFCLCVMRLLCVVCDLCCGLVGW